MHRVIVFDITSRDSFNGAKLWINEIYQKTLHCLIIIVANKFDLIEEYKNKNDKDYFVDPEEIKEYADRKINYILTSAKTGDNIDKTFKMIAVKL